MKEFFEFLRDLCNSFNSLRLSQEGTIAEDQGNEARAIARYHHALRVNPNNHWAHGKLACLYYEKKEYGPAITHYQQTLDLTDHKDYNLQLANSLAAESLFECAILHAEKSKDPQILEELLAKNYARFSPQANDLLAITHFFIESLYAHKAQKMDDDAQKMYRQVIAQLKNKGFEKLSLRTFSKIILDPAQKDL